MNFTKRQILIKFYRVFCGWGVNDDAQQDEDYRRLEL